MDLKAHEKNLRYLVKRNFLAPGRRRAIGIAGTSLVHHLDRDTLVEVMEVSGQTVGEQALLVAGLVPTPRPEALRLVERCTKLSRPPDFFLVMPVPGVCNPEGIRAELASFTVDCSVRFGARFLLYLRSRALVPAYARLAAESSAIWGIKAGTCEQDVAALQGRVPETVKVLWGVGDRATAAARRGSRGHTLGITLICPRACDEIHNHYCKGDFQQACRYEAVVAELEEIRFLQERAYNYSAVVAVARLAGFDDVDLGEEGPWNAPPPPEILDRLRACAARLREYH